MTADEMWMELKALISAGKKTDPVAVRCKVSLLLESEGGATRLLRAFEESESITGVIRILRELHRSLDSDTATPPDLTSSERKRLLKMLIISSKPYATTDSFYWDYLWLNVRDGDKRDHKDMLSTASLVLGKMNKFCKTPLQLTGKLYALAGGSDFPQKRWAALVSKTREVVVDVDLSNRLKAVVEIFTVGFVPALPSPLLPVLPVEVQPLQPTAPIMATSGEVPQPVSPPGPTVILPVQPAETVDGQVTQVTLAPPEKSESSLPPVETEREFAAAVTVSPLVATLKRKRETAVPPPPEPPRGLDPELAAFFGDMVAAVRSVAGPQEQIGGLTKEVAALATRMDGHDRRVADGLRRDDEVGELRTRIQEQQSELNATRRERDAAVGREKELARLVAGTDDRIDKANARAERNIYGAQQERDAALRTFKAGLWDAVRADIADVTDASPDEVFDDLEEKVIMTRLRNIRDALRREGVGP